MMGNIRTLACTIPVFRISTGKKELKVFSVDMEQSGRKMYALPTNRQGRKSRSKMFKIKGFESFSIKTLNKTQNLKWRKQMKPKSFSKKLSLNKKTIADLSGSEMKDVNGIGVCTYNSGCDITDYTCFTCNCPPTNKFCDTFEPDTNCGTKCGSNPCC
jgi:hypothetical protein